MPRIWPTAAADDGVLALTPRKIRLPDALEIGQPSPDLRVIPYIDRNDRAQIWDLVRGRPLTLTREADTALDEALVVAPDGRRVAVASWLYDDTWELRVLDTGADLRRPLIARQSAFEPIPTDWSSSGTEVLC